jgi:hypothetical protein
LRNASLEPNFGPFACFVGGHDRQSRLAGLPTRREDHEAAARLLVSHHGVNALGDSDVVDALQHRPAPLCMTSSAKCQCLN